MATRDSIRNFQRQREKAIQYPSGSPMTIRTAETVTAKRSVRIMACQFICQTTLRTSSDLSFPKLLRQTRTLRGFLPQPDRRDNREIFPPLVGKHFASGQAHPAASSLGSLPGFFRSCLVFEA